MIGAIDIGGTKIALGLVRQDEVLLRREVPTSACLGYADGLNTLSNLLSEMAAVSTSRLAGIGVGLTGRVEGPDRRIARNDFLPDWTGRDLVGDLNKRFGVSVAIENDADAAALAESAWGAGKNKKRFIYITVSTGIGGGIVLNDQLYRGVGGAHPEIGHHTLDPSGPLCYCGSKGCWERLASGTAMLEWVRAEVSQDLLPPAVDARMICDLAEAGVDWACQAVTREGYYLGLGLANLITIFAPECIALGGGVMQRWSLFAPTAMQVVLQNCKLVPAHQVEITQARSSKETPLIGAAQAWYQHQ